MHVSSAPSIVSREISNSPSMKASAQEGNISGNYLSKMVSTLMQSQPIQAASHIKDFVINLVSDLLSTMVELIKKVVHFFTNAFQNISNGQISHSSKEVQTDASIKTKTLVLEDLSEKALNDIFDKIEKFSLNSPEISKDIFQLSQDPQFWRRWASQLKIPHNSTENPKEKILKLLSFFKIDPHTRQATILKNVDKVKDALSIYPTHAYLIQSIPGLTNFNFYCRQPSGSFIAYENINCEDTFSESTNVTNDIVTDKSYTVLSLL